MDNGPRHGLIIMVSHFNKEYAIYQILLGWETYKYDYETDELTNPRPTQPKKN